MKFNYKSQYQQDQFIDKVVFNKKNKGFFIDIGAHDGVTFSNSFFFEKERNWDGICIEPNPSVFNILINNRNSKNYNVCIGNQNSMVEFTQIEGYSEMLSGVSEKYNKEHLIRINQEIKEKGGQIKIIKSKMVKLATIEDLENKTVDFISIDTEGNELAIIESIDFNILNVNCLVIENNYNDTKIVERLEQNNFKLLYKLHTDQVFIRKNNFTFRVRINLFQWKMKTKFIYILNKKLTNFFRI
jgi:FkbM family methyltransferase